MLIYYVKHAGHLMYRKVLTSALRGDILNSAKRPMTFLSGYLPDMNVIFLSFKTVL